MNYIYGLKCPIANTIRYVGKSNNPDARYVAHRCTARTERFNHHTARWLRKLEREGLKPELIILESLQDDQDWEVTERAYIENGKSFGWSLTNSTPGVEGGGFVRPEDKADWIRNVTASLQSDDVRRRISEGVKNAYDKNGMRERASARAAARWKDPVYRTSLVTKMAAARDTPESRENMRQHGKRRMSDPAERANVSEKMKAYLSGPQAREKFVKAMRAPEKVEANRKAQLANWRDPEFRERLLSAKTVPEVIEKQKIKARAQWADPEVRARMLAAMQAAQQRRREEERACPAKVV